MDLDGDSEDDLDILLGDMEPMIEKPQGASPPMRSFGYILLVTAGLAGLQGIFALIFSNGSAFLSSLGLSKPVLSLVWISGPFSGMILQPYFGMCSDQCRSTWGRRRPFIAGGALTAFVALFGLAFTERLAKELVRLWTYDPTHRDLLNIGEIQTSMEYTRPDDRMNSAAEYVAAGFAVMFFIILNISIQPLQGGLRALLADSCPRKQQSTANAVAGAVISASNIVSYTAGFTDLTRFTFLRSIGGGSQFSILCILTSIILTVAVTLTCLTVTDRNPLLNESVLWEHPSTAKDDSSISGRIRSLVTSFPRLPRQVRQVCKVQFFCWMGWFPYLFYMTTYIGDDFKRLAASAPAQSRLSEYTIHLRSTMLGSFGFLLFAIMAFVAGNLLPLAHNSARRRGTQGTSFVSGCLIRWFRSIRNLWITSQLIFSGCMTATFFVSSLQAVCVLVGLCGISWAVSIWAPFAIISTHVADDDDVEQPSKIQDSSPGSSSEFSESEKEPMTTSSDSTASMSHDNDNNDDMMCERRRGIVFGLHNVSIAGPQILAAVFCSLIFWALEGSSQDGIGWAMRAGGVAAFCAAVMARNVQID